MVGSESPSENFLLKLCVMKIGIMWMRAGGKFRPLI